jgi:hypothetical protein
MAGHRAFGAGDEEKQAGQQSGDGAIRHGASLASALRAVNPHDANGLVIACHFSCAAFAPICWWHRGE